MNRWSKIGQDALWDKYANSSIEVVGDQLVSKTRSFSLFDNEVPDLFIDDKSQITNKQNKFYNEILFPNYDDIDDFGTLLEKGAMNPFTKKLDSEVPYNAKVLELGCGTGQLSLYMSRYNRIIHGTDISVGSLMLAENFRKKHTLHNVFFSRQNVFNMNFKERYFDVIISNGVLHHTKSAKLGFEHLIPLLKPNGYIIIGLYHSYGRLLTKLKQKISPYVGENMLYFDKTLRQMKSAEKKLAWQQDQFSNPHETSHTLKEILRWFNESKIDFINSIPFSYKHTNKIFEKQKRPSSGNLMLSEPLLAFNIKQIREGGFFIVIGKKRIS